MDTINFDLISDLYIDHWQDEIEWEGIQTSLLAVVAGDVSSDLDRVAYELARLGKCYRQVVYIDGDLEHTDYQGTQANDYLDFKISKIKNCMYLRNNVVVFNNTAFIGANLWWTPWGKDVSELNADWFHRDDETIHHYRDVDYLKNTVYRMQLSNDVQKIALISHTVPNTNLVVDFPDVDYKTIGSNTTEIIDGEDLTNKITHWCFGHYHRPIDQTVDNIRYISNPRGRPDHDLGFQYYPKRITL